MDLKKSSQPLNDLDKQFQGQIMPKGYDVRGQKMPQINVVSNSEKNGTIGSVPTTSKASFRAAPMDQMGEKDANERMKFVKVNEFDSPASFGHAG